MSKINRNNSKINLSSVTSNFIEYKMQYIKYLGLAMSSKFGNNFVNLKLDELSGVLLLNHKIK
jgi:hypothetical protein